MLGEVSFKPKLIEFHSTSTYSFNWKIETAFQELPRFLNSEITTLGYPRAPLFGFCVALIAYMILSVVKAALDGVHGKEAIEKVYRNKKGRTNDGLPYTTMFL